MLACHQEYRTVVSKLKFLACVKKGDKIHTRYLLLQPKGLLTSLFRSLYPSDREDTLQFITHVFEQTINLLEKQSVQGQYKDNLITDLRNAMQGVCNLKFTYKDDLKIRADIDTLLDTMEVTLASLGNSTNI